MAAHELPFYWEVLESLAPDTAISMQVITPDGATADDSVQRPMPALVWYPPANWQPGETMMTTSMPWYLPRAWAPVLAVTAGGQALAPRVTLPTLRVRDRPALAAIDGRLQLPAWERRNTRLRSFDNPSDPRAEAAAHFAGDDWQVGLTHWLPLSRACRWKQSVSRHRRAANRSTDYNLFVDLRDESGPDRRHRRRSAELVCAASDFVLAGGEDGVWSTHAVDLLVDLAPPYDWQSAATSADGRPPAAGRWSRGPGW